MSVTSGYILEPFNASSPYYDDVVQIYLEAFGGVPESGYWHGAPGDTACQPALPACAPLDGGCERGRAPTLRAQWLALSPPGLVFTPGRQPFVVMGREINSDER